jgi:glutathione-regulated potassium-efflux system ancillary protein KefG
MPETRILINVVHPRLEQSTGNKALAAAAVDVPGVTIRDLYAEYPDGTVDVSVEQELLVAHDVIVFQHPLYWGSSPSLLKEWQDTVLQMGFAFPPGKGDALQGKKWQQVVTVGGPEESYRGGGNRFTLDQLLVPFQSAASFCGMQWQKPFIVYGVVPAGVMGAAGTDEGHLAESCLVYRELLAGL